MLVSEACPDVCLPLIRVTGSDGDDCKKVVRGGGGESVELEVAPVPWLCSLCFTSVSWPLGGRERQPSSATPSLQSPSTLPWA